MTAFRFVGDGEYAESIFPFFLDVIVLSVIQHFVVATLLLTLSASIQRLNPLPSSDATAVYPTDSVVKSMHR